MSQLQIRDAIHTRIVLSDEEQRILNHPYVQRLRYIRQLGFVPLVYPSATHDRLSHSLGAMHIAGIIARQITEHKSSSAVARILKPKEKEFFVRILRLAGLLHDIGHAPFSHSAELAMPAVASLALPRHWLIDPHEDRLATHEDYGALLIAGLSEGPHPLLKKEEAHIIASLIHHKKIKVPGAWSGYFSGSVHTASIHHLASSLISSNMDADRMDYLLRDSHFTGVPYGHFDLDWLISNLGVVEHANQYLLSIPETSILALEHYLFARYHMYTQVYMHKTAKCFEYYFQQALKQKELSYAIPSDRESFVMLRDSTLTEHLFQAASRNPDSWSSLLTRRIPAKRIARIWDDEESAKKIFTRMKRELKAKNVQPFLSVSHKKFLDVPPSTSRSAMGKQGAFLFDLAAIPIAVIRNQFGESSLASLADYSRILKQYHHDISITDIYIPRSQYDTHREFITSIIRKYRIYTVSEIPLKNNLP